MRILIITFASLVLSQCNGPETKVNSGLPFPDEMVHFAPYKNNPVFAGAGGNVWDKEIRERGFIIKEDSVYKMWYNGYRDIDDEKHLGYATSPDGFVWTRYADTPIYSKGWVEDVFVTKEGETYYMFAEGRNDIAHLLTSTDGINWTEQGNLDIRKVSGDTISKGAYGTPSVFKENNDWYLFYERDDLGIWVAKSKDFKVWTNVQDEPVIKMGPEKYDQFAVAMNQVVKYKGLYYGYYHASAFKDWHEWSTNVAVSKDLIHWEKYPGNPIVGNNKSSGILVNDGTQYRLYTMHPEVNVYFPDSTHHH